VSRAGQERTIATAVVAHFAGARRDLPWRATRDPYAIWVSEIMLQQTRVQTVIPYWQKWMAKFPTVGALAAAPLDDVLAAWAGLGYYSRARNLWSGARAVVEQGGALPARASELRSVPGIGPYTAGAIASIAFGERAPLVDGNVARVLARVYAIGEDVKSTAGQRALWARAGELMAALPASAAPGDLNQGLMELGATVCAPANPRCLACPLVQLCATRGDELPVMAARKRAHELPLLERAALWLEAGGEIVLARREPHGLFGGLWELPQSERALDVARALGVTELDAEPVAIHDQVLAHRRLRIAVFRGGAPGALDARALPGYDAIARVPLARARELGIAAATTAILSKYQDIPWSSIPKRSPSSLRATTRSSKASRSSASTSKTRTSPTPRSARRKASTSSSTTRRR
jgi:A/G-specific adenine glycosylase